MLKIVDLAHVMFNVTDLDRAIHFYRDLLGFKVSGGIEGQIVWMNFGQYHDDHNYFFHDLGLYQVPNALPNNYRKIAGINHAAFRLATVEEVDHAAVYLKDNGVMILKGPLTHKEDLDRYLYVEDPDGNVIEFVSTTLPDFPEGFLQRPVAEAKGV
jgi:catechol 2,3-dioxygenase